MKGSIRNMPCWNESQWNLPKHSKSFVAVIPTDRVKCLRGNAWEILAEYSLQDTSKKCIFIKRICSVRGEGGEWKCKNSDPDNRLSSASAYTQSKKWGVSQWRNPKLATKVQGSVYGKLWGKKWGGRSQKRVIRKRRRKGRWDDAGTLLYRTRLITHLYGKNRSGGSLMLLVT